MSARVTRRGFTLAEALVALFMIGVCMTVAARLFASGRDAMMHEETGLAQVRTARLCLETLRGDIEQADAASLKGAGSAADPLVMQRADASRAIRRLALPMPFTPSPDASPSTLPTPSLVTVKWWLDTSTHALVRDAGGAALSVGSEISGFTVNPQTPPSAPPHGPWVSIRLEIGEGPSALTFTDLIRPHLLGGEAP